MRTIPIFSPWNIVQEDSVSLQRKHVTLSDGNRYAYLVGDVSKGPEDATLSVFFDEEALNADRPEDGGVVCSWSPWNEHIIRAVLSAIPRVPDLPGTFRALFRANHGAFCVRAVIAYLRSVGCEAVDFGREKEIDPDSRAPWVRNLQLGHEAGVVSIDHEHPGCIIICIDDNGYLFHDSFDGTEDEDFEDIFRCVYDALNEDSGTDYSFWLEGFRHDETGKEADLLKTGIDGYCVTGSDEDDHYLMELGIRRLSETLDFPDGELPGNTSSDQFFWAEHRGWLFRVLVHYGQWYAYDFHAPVRPIRKVRDND